MSVIYGFSYSARVFVRIDCKSLSGTNTWAYEEKTVNYGQKSFITLAPVAARHQWPML